MAYLRLDALIAPWLVAMHTAESAIETAGAGLGALERGEHAARLERYAPAAPTWSSATSPSSWRTPRRASERTGLGTLVCGHADPGRSADAGNE
jgi:hypothetical protein